MGWIGVCQEQIIRLHWISNSDWEGDIDDRKSTYGYLFRISDATVSWGSKKQSCVVLSTTETKYMSLTGVHLAEPTVNRIAT